MSTSAKKGHGPSHRHMAVPHLDFPDANLHVFTGPFVMNVHCDALRRFQALIITDALDGEPAPKIALPRGDSADAKTAIALTYMHFESHRLLPKSFPVAEMDSVESWASMLRFSRKYNFPDGQELAKTMVRGQLLELSVPEILRLIRVCEAEEWTDDLYQHLVSRRSPLTAEEMRALGVGVSFLITTIREKCLQEKIYLGQCQNASSDDESA